VSAGRAGGAEQQKWSLLRNGAAKVRYSRLLKEDGEPVVVRVETLAPGWDSTHGTVFELGDELVEELEELAQAQGQAPTHSQPQAQADGEEARGEPEGNAQAWDQAANNAPQVETRETILEAVRQGIAPVASRPERSCRRAEPYGR
jgi:predicted transcriptional regulator